MIEVVTVGSNQIDEYWLEIYPFIEEALLAGDPDVGTEHIHTALLNQEMQLWVGEEAGEIKVVVITQIDSMPRNQVGKVILGAGEGVNDWSHYISVINNWFKSMGCTRSELKGRPGWQKIMKEYGFELESITMRKKL